MVYKPNQIVIIEVNDYHLELFSFWYLYLSYFKKNFNFFYPKKLQGLKEKVIEQEVLWVAYLILIPLVINLNV